MQQSKCALSMEKALNELKEKLTHHQQEVCNFDPIVSKKYFTIKIRCMARWIEEPSLAALAGSRLLIEFD